MSNYTQAQQDELESLLAGAALDALSSEDSARLDDYLKHDPNLELELCQFLACSVAIGEILPPISPPATLRSAILGALSSEPRARRIKSASHWHNWLIAASLAISAITGVYTFTLRQELSLAQVKLESLHGEDTHLYTLKGTPAARLASGLVLLDVAANRATIALHNLQPLNPGEVYYMWALMGSKVVPCGQFQVDAVNRVVEAIPIPADAYAEDIDFTLIVTVESTPNPVAPSAAIVMETKTEI